MTAVAKLEVEPERRSALVGTTPADLLRLAVERGADMTQIEKFMDLQQRWEKQEARKSFVRAMAEFKREPIQILKGKEVAFGNTKYSHAELSDVCDAVIGALARHDLMHAWAIEQREGQIIVTCTITHIDGHSESVQMQSEPDKSGQKNSIQAIASASTYLQRYTLLAITGLSTKSVSDDDGKGSETRTPMTDEHQATVQAKAEEISKTMLGSVLRSYKAGSLADIPDIEYASIIGRLEATAKKKEAK